ncbi:MAG: hypothetical protein IPJ65_29780 [Archangiaceae bacterium]|nr:hypothetical protein [Archangiaceae bacterium]
MLRLLCLVVVFGLIACRGEPKPMLADGKTVYRSTGGERWRVTRTAGAVPSSTYEQSYLRLERLGERDEVLELFNFEERAWVRPDGAERTWVDLSLDARGELQALQHQREPDGGQTLTRFRWNGRSLDRLAQ